MIKPSLRNAPIEKDTCDATYFMRAVAAIPRETQMRSLEAMDVISRRAVEGAIAADAYDRLAIAQDNIDASAAAMARLPRSGRRMRDAVDLGGMEDGKRPQERNASRMVIAAFGRAVIIYRELFVEKDGGAFFAPANLPSSFRCLLIGTPARIVAGKGRVDMPRTRVLMPL